MEKFFLQRYNFVPPPLQILATTPMCGIDFQRLGFGFISNFVLGMQSLETVKEIYNVISKYHRKFVLLHCISAYPAPISDINLNVIKFYQKEFSDVPIGYSGHELGIYISLAAVAIGAKVI